MTNLKVNNFETENFKAENFETDNFHADEISANAVYDDGKRVLTEHQSLDNYATKGELADKANLTYVDQQLADKCTYSYVGGVEATLNANISQVESTLNGKIAQMELKPATTSRLGGVKVGSGLTVTSDGTISASGGGGGDVPHGVKSYNVLNTFDMADVNWDQTTGTIAIIAMPWEQGDIAITAEMGYEFIYNNERTYDGVCHIGTAYGWYLFHKVPGFNCYIVQYVATGGW